MSGWFRMYEAVLDNPKVQRLPGETFKGWVNLLCLAKRHDGVLPSVDNIAFALRINIRQAEKLVETLRNAGLLDDIDGVTEPHDWHDLQYTSDSSADRVKRHRQRKRNGACNVTPTVTETPPEQIQSRTDTESPPTPPGGETIDLDFEDWIEEFPKRDHVDQARREYRQARLEVDAEVLLDGAKFYRGECVGREPNFVASPHRWLKDRRWEDRPAENGHSFEAADMDRKHVEAFVESRFWLTTWGPPPDQPDAEPKLRRLFQAAQAAE